MTDNESTEVAAAIRELAEKVDLLGNAVQSAAETIAKAIQPPERPGAEASTSNSS